MFLSPEMAATALAWEVYLREVWEHHRPLVLVVGFLAFVGGLAAAHFLG